MSEAAAEPSAAEAATDAGALLKGRAALRENGEQAAALVVPGNAWVRARTETIEMLSMDTARVELRVSYVVPDDFPGGFVPISVLPKWLHRRGLHIVDADGRGIEPPDGPALASLQEGLLSELSQRLSPASNRSARLRAAIRGLAHDSVSELLSAYATLKWLLDSDDGNAVLRERLADLASELVHAKILWVPRQPSKAGNGTVVATYEAPLTPERSRRTRMLSPLGLGSQNLLLPLRHLSGDAPYLLIASAPRGMEIAAYEPVLPGPPDVASRWLEGRRGLELEIASPPCRQGTLRVSLRKVRARRLSVVHR